MRWVSLAMVWQHMWVWVHELRHVEISTRANAQAHAPLGRVAGIRVFTFDCFHADSNHMYWEGGLWGLCSLRHSKHLTGGLEPRLIAWPLTRILLISRSTDIGFLSHAWLLLIKPFLIRRLVSSHVPLLWHARVLRVGLRVCFRSQKKCEHGSDRTWHSQNTKKFCAYRYVLILTDRVSKF